MLIRFARRHAMVIHPSFENDLLHLLQVVGERALVSICDFSWFDEKRRIAFHVDKANGASEGKA